MHLHLRDEARKSERRTPITPPDAGRLVEAGWKISVEASGKRIFADAQYHDSGCDITEPGSWTNTDTDTVVLGLKELPEDPPALANRMIHFAHIFKNQFGWREELDRFRKGGGTLYDIEYLVDRNGRRAAAFGYWAGWMGAALALWRHLSRQKDEPGPNAALSSFAGREQVQAEIQRLAKDAPLLPRCIVIGALGRSGSGAIDALKIAGCDITEWDKEETVDLDRDALLAHDLLVNCVLMTGPGLVLAGLDDLAGADSRIATISDVSCDPLSDYNPLPIYRAPTTWQKPFIKIGGNGEGQTIELTAIDNLPSLIPREASDDFSSQFTPVLMRFDYGEEWQAAKQVFTDKLKLALER
ncbi:MAG: saccharopine dehydrogenase [Hyphomicrobiales bacterium]|nr:saccharopine dehydrogenase [Hyphomicrobiales bacterium]MCP5002275.1 saccharopine dehydrogenase [Hyphomicrobiales bacterium]